MVQECCGCGDGYGPTVAAIVQVQVQSADVHMALTSCVCPLTVTHFEHENHPNLNFTGSYVEHTGFSFLKFEYE